MKSFNQPTSTSVYMIVIIFLPFVLVQSFLVRECHSRIGRIREIKGHRAIERRVLAYLVAYYSHLSQNSRSVCDNRTAYAIQGRLRLKKVLNLNCKHDTY